MKPLPQGPDQKRLSWNLSLNPFGVISPSPKTAIQTG